MATRAAGGVVMLEKTYGPIVSQSTWRKFCKRPLKIGRSFGELYADFRPASSKENGRKKKSPKNLGDDPQCAQ